MHSTIFCRVFHTNRAPLGATRPDAENLLPGPT